MNLIFKVAVGIMSRNTDLIQRNEGPIVDYQTSAVGFLEKIFNLIFVNLRIVPENQALALSS